MATIQLNLYSNEICKNTTIQILLPNDVPDMMKVGNPNYDRDQFIKQTTGIEIQEDVDHQGNLFLRVIEPSGREVIYTGKDAIRMIKNYNQTYLDANPDKTVDTSLIDNSNE